MNEQDKQAFETWWKWSKFKLKADMKELQEEAWQAALEYARQGAPVQYEPNLHGLFKQILLKTYSGKDSYFNDEQIDAGCSERASEMVKAANQLGLKLYTKAPAVAVNEQLLEALKAMVEFFNSISGGFDSQTVRAASDAIASAEAAKGAA